MKRKNQTNKNKKDYYYEHNSTNKGQEDFKELGINERGTKMRSHLHLTLQTREILQQKEKKGYDNHYDLH